ncbi:MAG: hypothetical protein HUU35_15595 [Armatimonadetes bacterium]|nr:hypothetical protein [Armatimonadota bacterium]
MPDRLTLIVDAGTTLDDLIAFVCSRAEPLRCGESLVWDFNNHPFDPERFEASGLPPGRYVVPFAMSEINLDLFALLPPKIAALTRLRFNPRAEVGGYSSQTSLLPAELGAERRARAVVEEAFAAAG